MDLEMTKPTSQEIQRTLTEIAANALNEAISFSREQIKLLTEVIGDSEYRTELENLGVGYIVSGSLGRLEALESSDIDLIALCDSDTNIEAFRKVDQKIRAVVRQVLSCDVSKGENFTGPTRINDIAADVAIGGTDDHVNALTKRIITLSEASYLKLFKLGY